MKKNICVIGLGYIGLPTACLISQFGYQVTGVDNNKDKLLMLSKNESPFFEPELDIFLSHAINSNSFNLSPSPVRSDIFIICVPTPFKKDKNSEFAPDTSYVKEAFRAIIPLLMPGNLVILESTCPVGTTEQLFQILQEERYDISKKIKFSYCPERVLPGKVFHELIENDRIVGGLTKESGRATKRFYKTFVKGEIHLTDSKTAEMAKLVENSFRDVNIAFANQLSIIADSAQIDVFELIKLSNKHPRVNILKPGAGVGGHCIAVDPWFLAYQNKHATLIKEARKINDLKPKWVLDKVRSSIRDFIKTYDYEPKVSCLGLAFKPNIDDFRHSPALDIYSKLSKADNIFAVEPFLKDQSSINSITFQDAIKTSDIIVTLVGHDLFKKSSLLKFSKQKLLLDFAGITKQ